MFGEERKEEEEEEEEGEEEGEDQKGMFLCWNHVSFGCLGFWYEFFMEISCSLF